jgi:putative phosphoesterase
MAMGVADTHRGKAIIIGLVSDTHGLIRNSLFEALAGVSQILHAGDVGGRAVLDALSAIAPVLDVYGNVDPIDEATPQSVGIEESAPSIDVSHGHELGSLAPARLWRYTADVIVFGHTHRPLVRAMAIASSSIPVRQAPTVQCRAFDCKPSYLGRQG